MEESKSALVLTATSESIDVMNCVPLIKASPSFSSSQRRVSPNFAKTFYEGIQSLLQWSHASPSPSNPSAKCDNGARSPDAPTVPCSGMQGRKSELKASMNFLKFSGWMPLLPLARVLILSKIILLTLSKETGLPTPMACERIKLSCNCLRFSLLMGTLANEPNPVVMPQTALVGSSIMFMIASLLLSTKRQVSFERSIFLPALMMSSIFYRVRLWPSRQMTSLEGFMPDKFVLKLNYKAIDGRKCIQKVDSSQFC